MTGDSATLWMLLMIYTIAALVVIVLVAWLRSYRAITRNSGVMMSVSYSLPSRSLSWPWGFLLPSWSCARMFRDTEVLAGSIQGCLCGSLLIRFGKALPVAIECLQAFGRQRPYCSLGKLLFEFVTGEILFVDADGFKPLVESHLMGAAIGALFVGIEILWRQSQCERFCQPPR